MSLFLADKYEEFKDIIDSKHKDVNTNRKKGGMGIGASATSSKIPHVERTMDTLKNKLSKLKSDSRDCLMKAMKSMKMTGGEKPPNEPNSAQQKS